MTAKRRTLLQIPRGTEGFSLDEAFRHRRIVGQLDRLYESWGYLPVHTPIFDFFDNYRPLLSERSLESVYRLIDREGDLLMLRSDITLFLARQMGLALRDEDLPVRLYYSDVILRHQSRADISRSEFFQSGVEFVGGAGEAADLEILMLLERTLATVGLPAVIHIGSRGLLSACAHGLPEGDREALVDAISGREADRLSALFQERDGASAGFLSRLFLFIGGREELSELLREGEATHALPEAALRELRYLRGLVEIAERLAPPRTLRIDFSEVGTQSYYTGMVFQAYLEGQDAAIASGGRYDRLLDHFGFPAPSVGFSLLLRKVEPSIPDGGRFDRQPVEHVKAPTFEEAFRKAESLRAAGKIAVLERS